MKNVLLADKKEVLEEKDFIICSFLFIIVWFKLFREDGFCIIGGKKELVLLNWVNFNVVEGGWDSGVLGVSSGEGWVD